MKRHDNALWKQYWRDQRTDLHQHGVSPALIRWWPSLHLDKGSRVLVPLCGKTQDMLWLTGQGYRVIGIELSALAIRTFFDENKLGATKRHQGQITRWAHGNLTILGSDVFAVTAGDLGPIDAVYDHAALTALAPNARKRYVAHVSIIAPGARQCLVLTAEDAMQGDDDETMLAVAPEMDSLYRDQFVIDLIDVQRFQEDDFDSAAASSMWLHHKVYRLTARNAAEALSTRDRLVNRRCRPPALRPPSAIQ